MRTPAQWTSSTGRQWVHLPLLPHAKKTLVRLHRGAFPQLWRLQGSITGAAAQAEVTLCTRRPPMGTKAIGATLNTRYTDSLSFVCFLLSGDNHHVSDEGPLWRCHHRLALAHSWAFPGGKPRNQRVHGGQEQQCDQVRGETASNASLGEEGAVNS